jgi:outer membrane protein assembly factor BamB
MRLLHVACFLAAAGCVAPVADLPPSGEPATPASDSALPPDLGTRKAGVDWPGFLGPTGDSVSPEKGILSPGMDGLRVVWEKKTGTGYGMPAISRGRLFLFDRVRDRARLTACKSETGEELWTFEYPTDYQDLYNYNNGPRCCPVVDRDRVYVFGPEGMLHCVRVADGKPVWKVDTRADFGVVQNFFGVGSTPVVEGDLLLVQVGGSPPGSSEISMDLQGNGSGLVAFDKLTGKVRYRVTDELASYAGPVLATIAGRRWCILFARGGLVGLDPATGKVAFHFSWRARILESVNAANPLVVGDRVLISETYGPGSALLKIKPDGSYQELWTDASKGRNKSLQCHWNTPIHVDGYVYGCSGRHTNNAELRCIELETGKVMWSEPNLTRTSLLLVDNHFVCLGEDGTLRLLKVNPKKYDEVLALVPKGHDGKPLLQYPCWAAPALSHGLLYVRGEHRLVCLELIAANR